jgi:hypothetical protein
VEHVIWPFFNSIASTLILSTEVPLSWNMIFIRSATRGIIWPWSNSFAQWWKTSQRHAASLSVFSDPQAAATTDSAPK